MTYSLTHLEGLEIAVEMERSGARFYEQAGKIAQDGAVQAALLRLAATEGEHEREFVKMRGEMREADGADEDRRFDGETSALLGAIAASVVFPGGVMAQAMRGWPGGERDILLAAVGSEKDAILFYQQLRAHAASGEAASVLSRIIQEEERHLVELIALLGDGDAEPRGREA